MSADNRLQQLRDILRDAESCGDEGLAEQIRTDIANEFPGEPPRHGEQPDE
jgi:hypothetical protein